MYRSLILSVCLASPAVVNAESVTPTDAAQTQAAAIYALSNTFERDPRFTDAFAPDFSTVQAQEPDKSVLTLQGCTVTALFAAKQRGLTSPSGDFQTIGVTMTFDLSVSDIMPNADGALYGYSDGGFFEAGKPQEDSAQTTFAFGRIQFESQSDITIVQRQTVPNVLILENVGTGPILRSSTEQNAFFQMTSAVSKARMQALADAIMSYKRDFCTLAS